MIYNILYHLGPLSTAVCFPFKMNWNFKVLKVYIKRNFYFYCMQDYKNIHDFLASLKMCHAAFSHDIFMKIHCSLQICMCSLVLMQ